MTDQHLIDCVVTHYQVIFPDDSPGGVMREITRKETCGWHVRPVSETTIQRPGEERRPIDEQPYLYLHNSAASARLNDLLTAAHEGRGWCAQSGTPPVYVAGEGWGGRNYPRIYVSAEALLELGTLLIKDAAPEGS